MENNELICVKCNRPVEKNKKHYETFEKMHWLCFHLEFEHSEDSDKPCDDPSCPWWHLEVFKKKLNELGHDPQEIINQAITNRFDRNTT